MRRPGYPAPLGGFRIRATVAATIVLGFLVALFAGCLSDEKQAEYHAYASKGSFVSDFAYDGKGVMPFGGDAGLDVSDIDNKGILVAKGSVGGAPFVVTFDRFSEAAGKKFQDGGIAGDFREHGASGVGDRSIPEVDLAMAGWGKATISRDGKPYIDPIGGGPDWTAHFMVIRNGVRNDTTGGIYQDPNNSKVYDKATGMGHSVPGDFELHLVLRNATPKAPPQPSTIQQQDTTAAAQYSITKALFISAAAGSMASFNISLTGPADVTFTVLAPGGTAVGTPVRINTLQSSPPGSKTTAPVSLATSTIGDYQIKATGMLGPTAGWEARGALTLPPSIVYNLWWEDLVFGAQAAEKIEQSGLFPHAH